MNFKKFLQISIVIFLLSNTMSTKASVLAFNNATTHISKEEEPSEHAKALLARLYEIQSMDKTNLTSAEKKTLRKELKGMKKEMKASGGLDSKVYISVGAIIIIILLIILLR